MTAFQRHVGALIVGLGGILCVPVASQEPPTFKAEVEYVEVDALVTNQAGALVKDLRKEDFQIFEDGKSQSIAGFAFIEIPVEAGDRSSAIPRQPDVISNEQPFAGRVYVLILDALHTAPERAPRVKRAAQQFIDKYLSANDLMAVLHNGGSSQGSQEFTSDKRLLSASVDRFMGQKLASATLARNELYNAGATGAVDDPFDAERGFNARATTRVLTEVADKLSAIRGRRKSILLVSEGLDYDITDVMNKRSAGIVLDGIRDAIAAATRSNVSIYAIDPRGLSTLGDDTIGVGMFVDQQPVATDTPDAPAAAPTPTGIGMSALRNELQISQDSLRTLSDETNGFAAVNANDFTSAFERIVNANSSYYVLAYYPPSGRRDGRFHRIEVRTSRPGLTIRARRGYVVPKTSTANQRTAKDDVSPQLMRALTSIVPASGLKMRLFVAPFIGTGANTSVLVGLELRGADLALADNNRLDLAYVSLDSSGETRTDKESFTLKQLPPETKARIKQTGIRFLKRLNLPPGRHQLRVGVYDTANGATGTVMYDLDVPAFSKQPFSMSGLLVTSREALSTVTARGDPELQKFLKLPPAGLRAFPQNDEVGVITEIYDRSGTTAHTVDIKTTVTSQEGKVVFEHNDQRSSAELQGANGAYVHGIGLPIGELPPGSYVLTIEARSRLGQSASRQIEFTVTAAR